MKKGFLLLLAFCCLTLPAFAAGPRFSDVPDSHWANEPIEAAAEAGVVTGYGDGCFHPDDPVTAVQFCAFLSRSVLSGAAGGEAEDLSWQTRALNICAPALAGTSLETAYQANGETWGDFINRPLARFDMAQMLYNLLDVPEAPDAETKAAAQKALDDWGNLPFSYRDAIAVCYDRNLLRGQTDGRFNGNASVTRAQACVVLARLQDLLRDVPAELAEAAGVPVFRLEEGDTVQKMMDRINTRTPLHRDGGCLSNGKEITDENLQELLEVVKAGCPDGTVWTRDPRYHYNSPKLGSGEDCLAFGMAVSDFLFGEDAKLNQYWNWRNLKTGDLIHIKTSGAERVVILTSVDPETYHYTACEFRTSEKVRWTAWGNLNEFIDDRLTTVYKRY